MNREKVVGWLREAAADRNVQIWGAGVVAGMVGFYLLVPGFFLGFLFGVILLLGLEIAGAWLFWLSIKPKPAKLHLNKDVVGSVRGNSQDGAKLEEDDPSYTAFVEASELERTMWVSSRPCEAEQDVGHGKLRRSVKVFHPLMRQAELEGQKLLLAGPHGISEIIYLDGCEIKAYSETEDAKKKWQRKFPMRIRHPSRDIWQHSREMYIYFPNGWQKELWCLLLRRAARPAGSSNPDWQLKLKQDYAMFRQRSLSMYPDLLGAFRAAAGPDLPSANTAEPSDVVENRGFSGVLNQRRWNRKKKPGPSKTLGWDEWENTAGSLPNGNFGTSTSSGSWSSGAHTGNGHMYEMQEFQSLRNNIRHFFTTKRMQGDRSIGGRSASSDVLNEVLHEHLEAPEMDERNPNSPPRTDDGSAHGRDHDLDARIKDLEHKIHASHDRASGPSPAFSEGTPSGKATPPLTATDARDPLDPLVSGRSPMRTRSAGLEGTNLEDLKLETSPPTKEAPAMSQSTSLTSERANATAALGEATKKGAPERSRSPTVKGFLASGPFSKGLSGLGSASAENKEVSAVLESAVLCANALLARIFFDLNHRDTINQKIQAKFNEKLSVILTPKGIGPLTCKRFNFGDMPPLLRSLRPATAAAGLPDGFLAFDADLLFHGRGSFAIETRLDLRDSPYFRQDGTPEDEEDYEGEEGVGDEDEWGEIGEEVGGEIGGEGLAPSRASGEDGQEVGSSSAQRQQDGSERPLTASSSLSGPSNPKASYALKESKSSMRSLSSTSQSGHRKGLGIKGMLANMASGLSQVPLSITITVTQVKGVLRIRVPPPPSDRLWMSFVDMPDLKFQFVPSIGEKQLKRFPMATTIVEKLKGIIKRTLVLPACNDVPIKIMTSDADDWLPREPFMLPWRPAVIPAPSKKPFGTSTSEASAGDSSRQQGDDAESWWSDAAQANEDQASVQGGGPKGVAVLRLGRLDNFLGDFRNSPGNYRSRAAVRQDSSTSGGGATGSDAEGGAGLLANAKQKSPSRRGAFQRDPMGGRGLLSAAKSSIQSAASMVKSQTIGAPPFVNQQSPGPLLPGDGEPTANQPLAVPGSNSAMQQTFRAKAAAGKLLKGWREPPADVDHKATAPSMLPFSEPALAGDGLTEAKVGLKKPAGLELMDQEPTGLFSLGSPVMGDSFPMGFGTEVTAKGSSESAPEASTADRWSGAESSTAAAPADLLQDPDVHFAMPPGGAGLASDAPGFLSEAVHPSSNAPHDFAFTGAITLDRITEISDASIARSASSHSLRDHAMVAHSAWDAQPHSAQGPASSEWRAAESLIQPAPSGEFPLVWAPNNAQLDPESEGQGESQGQMAARAADSERSSTSVGLDAWPSPQETPSSGPQGNPSGRFQGSVVARESYEVERVDAVRTTEAILEGERRTAGDAAARMAEELLKWKSRGKNNSAAGGSAVKVSENLKNKAMDFVGKLGDNKEASEQWRKAKDMVGKLGDRLGDKEQVKQAMGTQAKKIVSFLKEKQAHITQKNQGFDE